MTDLKKGKVIPFAQGASFYMKRGAKEMEKNDLLNALSRYRQAMEKAPDDPEPWIAASEILSQMQRFEESNRLLMLLVSAGKGTAECFFGLACNYFGMQEYDYAVDSLENYLDADPDGPFAMDAEDFLDFLDDDGAMFEATGLNCDQDYDDNASCLFARHLMESGEYADAIKELQHQLTISPDSMPVRNQLAVAYLVGGEQAQALTLVQQILAEDPKNVLARCNLALLYHESGNEAAARAEMEPLNQLDTDAPDELHNISIMQLDLGLFQEADATIKKLLQFLPYDENAIHKQGYCRYMTDDFQGAATCYKRLLKIHPDDTVARYYLAQCKKTELDHKARLARWMIPYQVPFSETFRRLNQINHYLASSEEELRSLWEKDHHFTSLLLWGLSLPEPRIKKSMLSLLYTFQDKKSEFLLRDYLLRTDQPDAIKRVVFGMLKHLGAQEPYMAYLNGQWISGRVSMLEFKE